MFASHKDPSVMTENYENINMERAVMDDVLLPDINERRATKWYNSRRPFSGGNLVALAELTFPFGNRRFVKKFFWNIYIYIYIYIG